jgi:hypothetical protein
VSIDTEKLDRGQLDFMWNFLKMGTVKSNIPALKNLLDDLQRLMTQKTAGQEPYAKKKDIPFEDIGTIINSIVIETMMLYLSGDLDKLEKMKKAETDGKEVQE